MESTLSLWIGFNVLVVVLLFLDLSVFHRKDHVIEVKEALLWSAIWILLALLFNVGVYFWSDKKTALEFLAGYLIEKSLSIDNLFVFLLIFSYFGVAGKYQYRVLYWGILGALIMRGLLILGGVVLINKFYWVIYVFGAFLIVTGIRMVFRKEGEIHPERNPVIRLFKWFMPVTRDYHAQKFFVRQDGRMFATPLFVVLLVINVTDLVFAFDSIPAIIAITRDPFIIYSSNVFAILGLRALYFALAGIMSLFHYLKHGLAAILVFVGGKMVLADVYHISIGIALGVIAGILAISIVASVFHPKRPEKIPSHSNPEPGDSEDREPGDNPNDS